MSTRVLWCIVVIAVVTGLVFGFYPEFDLQISSLFYDSTSQRFPIRYIPFLRKLRHEGIFLVYVCMICALAPIVLKLLLPSRPLLVSGRAAIFLILTFALGPGLIVNGTIKQHWARPRPIEVANFGGTKPFVAWWDPRGTCRKNCSFMSGEAATAAWILAPAALLPAPWRFVAIGSALVFTAGLSFLRIAFGAHFFTDVVFGILVTALVIWTMHGLIFRWPRTALDESAIDRAIGRFARAMRGRVDRLLGRQRPATRDHDASSEG
jgi:membrane-associated PAP2 superfamily phosphatase